MRRPYPILFALLILCALLLAACAPRSIPTTAEPTEPPAPTNTSAPVQSPTNTAAPAEAPVETPVEALPTEAPASPAAPAWPDPITPEEPFTRSAISADEQATFDLLAQANFAPNDPIALAIAIKGIPGPVDPIVAAEALTLAEGTVQTFWVHNQDTREWVQIEARLERVTEHAYLWFDTSRELVDTTVYDKAAEAFEVMYEPDRAVYGSEWNPGIDGDPHVYVLHASALALCNVTEATAHQCGLLGYFSTTDELPATIEPHSNQHELFVMNVDAGGIGGERYLLTLVHEFRHMIEYNHDRHDDDWEVEGTAMMAEDLLGYTAVPSEYANSYTQAGTDVQLNAWTSGNTIPHYGKGYLLARFIYNRLGPDFYSAWVQHPERAFFALDAVLADFSQPFTALDLWLDWTAAISLLGFENVPAEYSFGEGLSFDPADKIAVNAFPKEIEEEVTQFGFDVFNVRATAPVQLTFTGSTKVAVLENVVPASGNWMWWSGRANQSDMSLTREFDLTGVSAATLNYAIFHSTERGWDFAYVFASTDGGETWQTLEAPSMVGEEPNDDPGEAALTERFYTGRSKGWVNESIDLTPFAGQKVLIRFQYITDAVLTAPGMAVDNVSIPEIGFFDDMEASGEGWVAQGFVRVTAYEPQRFHLLLVTFGTDGVPAVQRIEIAADNTASIEIPLSEANSQALLIVAASNPLIMTPTSYTLSFGQ